MPGTPIRNEHVASKVNEWLQTVDLDDELAAAMSKWSQKAKDLEESKEFVDDDDDEYEEITVEDDEIALEKDEEITVEDEEEFLELENNPQERHVTFVIDNEQEQQQQQVGSPQDEGDGRRESLADKVQEWVSESSLNDPELAAALSKWSQSKTSPAKEQKPAKVHDEEKAPEMGDRLSLTDASFTIHEDEAEDCDDEEQKLNSPRDTPGEIVCKNFSEDITEALSDSDDSHCALLGESILMEEAGHNKDETNPMVGFLRGIGDVLAKLARPCNKPEPDTRMVQSNGLLMPVG